MAKKTTIDMSQIFNGLRKMRSIEEPVARAMGSAMGASVRDEAKVRAPVGDHADGSKRPGSLRDAVYQAYNARRNVLQPHIYEYVVSWNSKKAPHGHLLEYGHWMPYQYRTDGQGNFWSIPVPQPNGPKWVAARPFIGPAYYAKMPTLLVTAVKAGQIRFGEIS